MRVRRVRLRVEPCAYLPDYHGREAGLIGSIVDAVEVDADGFVAYVDDSGGECEELVDGLELVVRGTRMHRRLLDELQAAAAKRLLHGTVVAVRGPVVTA